MRLRPKSMFVQAILVAAVTLASLITSFTTTVSAARSAGATTQRIAQVGPPVPIGGPYVGDPSAVFHAGERVFALDAVGQPFMHGWDPLLERWTSASPLGGVLTTTPVPAQPYGPTSRPLEVLGVGVDRAMWLWTPTSGWRSLGGVFVGTPAAVQIDDTTHVVGVGQDGALWHQQLSTATAPGWRTLGGRITSDPAVAISGGDVVVVGRGSDEAMWTRGLTRAGWSPWRSLGGRLISYPTLSAGDLFAIGGDDAVWLTHVGATATTTPWLALGGISTSGVATGPGPSAIVVGIDGQLWRRTLGTPPSEWTAWEPLGGEPASNPTAIGRHVFWIDAGGTLFAVSSP